MSIAQQLDEALSEAISKPVKGKPGKYKYKGKVGVWRTHSGGDKVFYPDDKSGPMAVNKAMVATAEQDKSKEVGARMRERKRRDLDTGYRNFRSGINFFGHAYKKDLKPDEAQKEVNKFAVDLASKLGKGLKRIAGQIKTHRDLETVVMLGLEGAAATVFGKGEKPNPRDAAYAEKFIKTGVKQMMLGAGGNPKKAALAFAKGLAKGKIKNADDMGRAMAQAAGLKEGVDDWESLDLF